MPKHSGWLQCHKWVEADVPRILQYWKNMKNKEAERLLKRILQNQTSSLHPRSKEWHQIHIQHQSFLTKTYHLSQLISQLHCTFNMEFINLMKAFKPQQMLIFVRQQSYLNFSTRSSLNLCSHARTGISFSTNRKVFSFKAVYFQAKAKDCQDLHREHFANKFLIQFSILKTSIGNGLAFLNQKTPSKFSVLAIK